MTFGHMFLKIGGCQIIAAFCSVSININVTTCRETSTRVRYAGKYMFTSMSASYAFGVDKKMLLCVVLIR